MNPNVRSGTIKGPGDAQTPPAVESTYKEVTSGMDASGLTLLVGEARVFAEAGLRMLEEAELEQAASLFLRAALFAARAAP